MDNSSLISSQQTKTILIGGQEYPVILCATGARGLMPKPRLHGARRDTVGVFMPNSERPENFRFTIEVARELRAQGLADFINRKCDVRLKQVSKIESGACTIRMTEVEANAGLYGISRTAHLTDEKRREMVRNGKIRREEDFVERTQEKVAAWPHVGSDRAVTVQGGRIAQPIGSYFLAERDRWEGSYTARREAR